MYDYVNRINIQRAEKDNYPCVRSYIRGGKGGGRGGGKLFMKREKKKRCVCV